MELLRNALLFSAICSSSGGAVRPRTLASQTRAAACSMCEPAPDGPRPSLCVLDLDMCAWSPEMYMLGDMPDRPIIGDLNGRGEGVVGVHSGVDVIKLFPGALAALQESQEANAAKVALSSKI